MDPDLSKHVAVVTGASSGLGRHFAGLLAKHGARVALAGRRLDRLRALAHDLMSEGAKTAPISLDVTDAKQIPRALDEVENLLGPIDILVNNAGISVQGLAVEFTADAFDSVMHTNVRGPFLLATEVGRRLIARSSLGGSSTLGRSGLPRSSRPCGVLHVEGGPRHDDPVPRA